MKLLVLLTICFVLSMLCDVSHTKKSRSRNKIRVRMNVKLVSVLDGDTIIVETKSGEKVRIRFAYIDAPEKKQAYGPQATQFLSDIIGQNIQVVVHKTDFYGRTIAEVFSGGLNINKAMVDNGFAWCYRMKCPENYKVGMETSQQDKIGLWKDSNPISPWEYRKNKKSKQSKKKPQTNDEIINAIKAIRSKTKGTESVDVSLWRVLDGDTIIVTNLQNNTRMRIRMVYIDAPESSQEAGVDSKNYLERILEEGANKQLQIRVTGRDRYRRTLGVVKLGRRDVNKMMVTSGFAWCYKTGCPRSYLTGLKRARAQGLGLWAYASPKAPWIYRRNNRASG